MKKAIAKNVKAIKAMRLQESILSPYHLHCWETEGAFWTGLNVRVKVGPGTDCYTHFVGKTGRYSWSKNPQNVLIVIGKGMYFSARGLKPSIELDVVTASKLYDDMYTINYAIYDHEIAHVRYTDMRRAQEIVKKLIDKGAKDIAIIFKSLSNIVEDIVIEFEIGHYDSGAKARLARLQRVMFNQDKYDKYMKPHENEESIEALLHFLLYKYRVPTTVGTQVLYEEHKDFIHKSMITCLNTLDSRRRMDRVAAFSYELYKLLRDKIPTPLPPEHVTPGPPGGPTTPGGPTIPTDEPTLPGGPGEPVDPKDWIDDLPKEHTTDDVDEDKLPDDPTDITNTKFDEDSDDKDGEEPRVGTPIEQSEDEDELFKEQEDEEDIIIETTAKRKRGTPPSNGKPLPPNIIIKMAANDEPIKHYDHLYMHINKYKRTTRYLPMYQSIVRRYRNIINKMSDLIKKMFIRGVGRWNGKQLRGKRVDVREIWKKDTIKVWKNKTAPMKVADLCILLLMDNSGSMKGTKSKIAGIAGIVLGESIHSIKSRKKVPFAVMAFTEGNIPITIGLKEFHESWDKTKTNLCLFTEQFNVRKLSTFSGNVDEVNLQYAYDMIRRRPEKDKVVIVISDGETTGSWRELRDLAATMEKDGIDIVSVGIMSREVEKIYSNYKVFNSTEELNELPRFFQEVLFNKLFKGGK